MQTMKIIDSHAHLDFAEFDNDRAELVAQMKEANIHSCIIPGVSPAHWARQLEVANEYGWPIALGVHPWWAVADWQWQIKQLRTLIESQSIETRLVAVGECGLDKLHSDNWQWQMPLLEAQIEIACELKLPLILHCVRAHNELLSLLALYDLPRKGVIHGFYGSLDIARRYVDLGFRLGIGGLILNEGANKLRQVVAELPLDSFLCETDSPSMAPKSFNLSRNSPLTILPIITKMADLKKKSDVLICERLLTNVSQLFEL